MPGPTFSPDDLIAAGISPSADAGKSTCPVCQLEWLVTPYADCLMPACGCFGFDSSEANPNRPCEDCGLKHARTCEKMSNAAG